MTNEVDNKPVVRESEGTATAAEATAINSVDLLKPQPNARDEIKASVKELDSKDHLGKLEILDDKIEKKIEDWGSIKSSDFKLEPLNRTESMILNNMRDALRQGSVEQVQDMLKTLAENPKSVERVLQTLKSQMESENYLNHVNWETGKDNNGNAFIRLNMYHADSASKSSGGTDLTIGSDGRNSASYRARWDSPAKPTDPQDALSEFVPHKERYYEIPGGKKPYYVQPDLDQNSTLKNK